MIRGTAPLLFFLVVVLFAGPAAAAPVLKLHAVVDDDVIRIGDMFDDAGDKADIAVAPAPRLGRQAVYDANWLYAMARAQGLAWQPVSAVDHIVVERAGQRIEPERMREAVSRAVNAALAARQPGKTVDVEFDGRVDDLFARPSVAPNVRVSDLLIDDLAERFTVTVGLRGEEGASVRVAGRIFDVVRVPVLTRRMGHGEVVDKGDLDFIQVRADELGRDIVTDESRIVGMAPRRMLAEGQPIREGDLRAPIVVAKGSLVGMTLTTPNMVLTAQGRAIEDGAMGQVIKVMNTQSKTTVDAVVDGPGRVVVSAPGLTTADAR
jgi:flagella basal body P-ring formation protein FlgA